jgi:hypothetical protein
MLKVNASRLPPDSRHVDGRWCLSVTDNELPTAPHPSATSPLPHPFPPSGSPKSFLRARTQAACAGTQALVSHLSH